MSSYDPNWQEQGRCAGLAITNPDLFDIIFFPGKGKPSNNPQYKKFCVGCPVQDICLRYAIANNLDGIWGGSTKS